MTDDLQPWERWPVAALFVAQGLQVFEWYADVRMPPEVRDVLPWLVTVAGVAAFVAIDGAMIATVAGMRAGRRSPWSIAAIVLTAAFGALVALNLHGALSGLGPWLHAGFALTIAAYLLHLAQPRVAAPRTDAAEPQHITQAVQVNVAASPQLPRTLAAYIQARAVELPQHTPPALAAELGTSADTVRRALAVIQANEMVEVEK